MALGSHISEGLPHPLGATWDGVGVNFALFSANATKVELCLFDGEGKDKRASGASPDPLLRTMQSGKAE